jgi:hypothetical protein
MPDGHYHASSSGLIRVDPKDLTEAQVELLLQFCAGLDTGVEPKHVIAQAITGQLGIWRTNLGDSDGLFLLKIAEHPAGRELIVWGIVGEGIIPKCHSFMNELKDIGRALGCVVMTALTEDPRLRKIYERRLNFPAVAVQHKMRV